MTDLFCATHPIRDYAVEDCPDCLKAEIKRLKARLVEARKAIVDSYAGNEWDDSPYGRGWRNGVKTALHNFDALGKEGQNR